MMSKTKWQSPVYAGEGPSRSDVLSAKLVASVLSCQPNTRDHMTRKGQQLPRYMVPAAAGRGTEWKLQTGHLSLLTS